MPKKPKYKLTEYPDWWRFNERQKSYLASSSGGLQVFDALPKL